MTGSAQERLSDLDRLHPVWEEHTVWTMFQKMERLFAMKPFLVSGKNTYTYKETKTGAEKLSDCLWQMGVRPGAHVAVQLYNCPEYIMLSLALSRLGAVRVPLQLKIKEDYFRIMLDKADAEWLFTVFPDFDTVCCRIADGVWMRRREGELQKISTWAQFCSGLGQGSGMPETEAGTRDIREKRSNELSDIIFTSGSTQDPKGVMLTPDMMMRSAYASCRSRYMEIGRRMYIPIPFCHAFGYIEGFLAMMLSGGCMILSEGAFSPVRALEVMKAEGANDIICISSMMVNLLQRGKPDPGDFPAMHAAYWAGVCPDWIWEQARKAFGIRDVTTGYGMTECCSTTFMLSPDDPPEFPARCHGRLKNAGCAGGRKYDGKLMEVRIRDPKDGRNVPQGEKGELQCRGLTVTAGYYGDENATREAFTEDGWFRTGDICFRLENGCYVFCERKDDVYKINGENVSPAYLDKVIAKCPGVRAVQTVGIHHLKYGAIGVAFVDTGENPEKMRLVLEDYMKRNLAGFQIPRYIIFSRQESWPVTETGKIAKARLKETAMRKLTDQIQISPAKSQGDRQKGEGI